MSARRRGMWATGQLRFSVLAAILIGALGLVPIPCRGQMAVSSRQVTLFGIVAVPNSRAIDPKLKQISPQLRKLLPNHGFKLLEVQSKRLIAGQTLTADLGHGYIAETELIEPLDSNGKVELRCGLDWNEQTLFQTLVTAPPNQLFFCDKQLANGSRLLIGIGAR